MALPNNLKSNIVTMIFLTGLLFFIGIDVSNHEMLSGTTRYTFYLPVATDTGFHNASIIPDLYPLPTCPIVSNTTSINSSISTIIRTIKLTSECLYYTVSCNSDSSQPYFGIEFNCSIVEQLDTVRGISHTSILFYISLFLLVWLVSYMVYTAWVLCDQCTSYCRQRHFFNKKNKTLPGVVTVGSASHFTELATASTEHGPLDEFDEESDLELSTVPSVPEDTTTLQQEITDITTEPVPPPTPRLVQPGPIPQDSTYIANLVRLQAQVQRDRVASVKNSRD